MTTFLIPCFIVAEADNQEQALALAARHQTMKNGSVLLIDEELNPVKISSEGEYPHTMKNLVDI